MRHRIISFDSLILLIDTKQFMWHFRRKRKNRNCHQFIYWYGNFPHRLFCHLWCFDIFFLLLLNLFIFYLRELSDAAVQEGCSALFSSGKFSSLVEPHTDSVTTVPAVYLSVDFYAPLIASHLIDLFDSRMFEANSACVVWRQFKYSMDVACA